MENAFDVVVVGAGPGGSAAAASLGQAGVSALVLDKAVFPRDKVCGDGLIGRALFWLDRLGCVDEVLGQTRSFITGGDLFIDGEHLFNGDFPQNTAYPGFSILLERKKLDHTLVRRAVSCGAVFRPGCKVRSLSWEPDHVIVHAEDGGTPVEFQAKLVIGADGANSVVSRAIGNRVLHGTTAASMRGYYENVQAPGSAIQIYFDEAFFPGYGWLFVDEDGKANIGVGCVFDRNFPVRVNLRKTYEKFVSERLKTPLRNARPLGKARGGVACYYAPLGMVADRVLLVGDAANLGDPLNGGGIHTALESGCYAAQTALDALKASDFTAAFLGAYQRRWTDLNGMDWRTGELFLTIAKNPGLRAVYLRLLRALVEVAGANGPFREFCGGIFTGLTPTRKALCPRTLLGVTPFEPGLWLSALLDSETPGVRDVVRQALWAARAGLGSAQAMMTSPIANARWAAEVASKVVGVAECYARREFAQLTAGAASWRQNGRAVAV